MEPWLIYTIISVLFSGLYNFGLKMVAERKYDTALEGNLAIVFTINSFGILVPIVLSIWFYGESFSLKKGIVIALSIVSIILFI